MPGSSIAARQLADRPRAQAAALEPGHSRGELRAQARTDLVAQPLQVVAAGDLPALLVLQAEGHAQVGGQPREVPRIARDAHAAQPFELARERVEQRLAPGLHALERLRGHVGHRHERAPQLLGQRADQRGDELEPEPGHEPVEAGAAQRAEHGQRHVHGDAVVVAPRARSGS